MNTPDHSTKNKAVKPPNVLIVAYGCEPFATSEPGVGWNFVREICEFANVWIVTRSNNRQSIESALTQETKNFRERSHWLYVDLNRFFTKWKNQIPFGIQAYYTLWQWKSLITCLRIKKSVHFDLAHHLTYGINWMSPTLPILNIPFIWGPIGGGSFIPSGIIARESRAVRIQEWFYRLISYWIPKVSPFAAFVRNKAAYIIYRTTSAEQYAPKSGNFSYSIICETAMATAEVEIIKHTQDSFLRIVSVGRMQYWKGFRYAVEGFHKYLEQGGEGRLVLLGDGPCLEQINQYCKAHNLADRITLAGNVSQKVVIETMRNSDLLLHPSFRDGGSWSVLEAMTQGLPVVCLNASGLADMVTPECGILVDPDSPEAIVNGIAASLMLLSEKPGERSTMGKNSRSRVDSEYSWQYRGKQIKCIYKDVISQC